MPSWIHFIFLFPVNWLIFNNVYTVTLVICSKKKIKLKYNNKKTLLQFWNSWESEQISPYVPEFRLPLPTVQNVLISVMKGFNCLVKKYLCGENLSSRSLFGGHSRFFFVGEGGCGNIKRPIVIPHVSTVCLQFKHRLLNSSSKIKLAISKIWKTTWSLRFLIKLAITYD